MADGNHSGLCIIAGSGTSNAEYLASISNYYSMQSDSADPIKYYGILLSILRG